MRRPAVRRERAVRLVLGAIALLLAGSACWAIDPEPEFSDPAMQAEYQSLIREVRCLVCQNQTIADSNAALAADLRREIARLLNEGASRADVTDFLVARYGDFILYRPPLQPSTWTLWGAPFVLLGIGAIVVVRIVRSRARQSLAGDDTA
jgi:cytochrome c-type biogenesis protein CcmH